MQRPLGAQISHMLKDRGVEVIFGIPGVHNQELYRGIEEAGITHILARHEQGAGFMADGYARATGKPGVCYVITGPGLTNILTPLGQAYSDSVPLLVISSCLDETAARKGQLHQMRDQRAAAATVCDWSEEARTAEAAYRLIDRAFYGFYDPTQRHRPCHVQVPIAALTAPVDGPPERATWNYKADWHVLPQSILEPFLRARRPLFVFGGGVAPLGQLETGGKGFSSADLAATVARSSGAASFVTSRARGAIPPDDPLHLGGYLTRPDSSKLIASSDCVIAVGSELAEVDLWRRPLGHSGTLIRVDNDGTVLTDHQERQETVRMGAGKFLLGLSDALPERRSTDWTASEIAAFRAKARAEVEAEYPGVLPAIDALRDCLPDNCMIYSDMTQFAYAALEVWDMPRPGHWHHPYGFGTLGYALPAAIGGAVARRGLPTLAIAGDYGFQYTLNELGTAVELGLSLPILLWDNGKLGAIEASMTRAQIAPNAVIARNPDFGKLAEAYGALSAEPTSLKEMQAAVLAAFDAGRPTLIRATPGLA